ncbi:molecular chaperone HscC [Butyrivibrio sp. X503]|uniref:Hsp70 family protein n=1 Tax=Butyrivibrio sp. X503 TaxID=2364878 RepID=UPI000EA874F2|nr:molecular chaperone HscC [Butyrivibrio sp. X503]RKM55530.1 molecular chaperone HscC [Butyrivibrio sp. X503]
MNIGIDLGTTNSLVAVFDKGNAEIVENRLGERLTPSAVAVDEDGTVLVGKSAKEYGILHPERTAEVFKRFIGSDKQYNLGGKLFRPEDLSALVLKSLKEDVEKKYGEKVVEAVISVPAYFDDDRRKATKLAGQLAGLKVERIISEPTAAAITYGLYDKKDYTRFLVFDLGGGTFDVSILELSKDILEVRAVAGDNYLGGENFTDLIYESIFSKLNIDKDKCDRKTLSGIREAAENIKTELSDKALISSKIIIDGKEKEYSLSEREFEEMSQPLLDKLRGPLQRSINDARIKLSDIDEVVLVGGATRMPVIRKFLSRLFRKFPDTMINPDEAVAIGTCIQAAMKERRAEVKEIILTDVCGFSLGVQVSVGREDGSFESGHFSPIIERNTVIPASRTEIYYTTHDDQEVVDIEVYQGESRKVSNNLYLGDLSVNVPKNLAGMEKIEVTFTYDINAILEVEVRILSTGQVTTKLFKGRYNRMTDEEIAERMKQLSYLKIAPRDLEENRLLLIRAERAYEESLGSDRALIEEAVTAFEEALEKRDKAFIFNSKKKLIEIINQNNI